MGSHRSRLQQQFAVRLQRFTQQLGGYLENPDAAAIHGLRTSFRRMQAAASIYPRRSWTPESRQYLATARQLFRLNSVVRDSDIMLTNLAAALAQAPQRGADREQLWKSLQQQRATQLESALAVARHLERQALPVLSADRRALHKGLRKRVTQRLVEVLLYEARIRADESNSEDLHSMRKQAKKLYYLLELISEPKRTPQMAHVKDIHTTAGAIHDCDVTIQYLNDCSSLLENSAALIRHQEAERHNHFTRLLALLDQVDWRVLKRLV